MTTSIRQYVPTGKFRVIGYDLFANSDYLVKDCDDKVEAFKLADDHNRQRSGPMSDVFYVYDDKGEYLRGEEAIKNQEGEKAIGVSP